MQIHKRIFQKILSLFPTNFPKEHTPTYSRKFEFGSDTPKAPDLCPVQTIEGSTSGPVSKSMQRPPWKTAITQVLGARTMNISQICTGLKAMGWFPKISKQNPKSM